MNLTLYTICWNESKIAPFVFEYWNELRRQIGDGFKVVAYDNMSDDGTKEAVAALPYAEVLEYDTGGKLSDAAYLVIKNGAWKKSRSTSDFVAVCDFDECLYSKDVVGLLAGMKSRGETLLRPQYFNMTTDSFPKNDGKLFHKSHRSASVWHPRDKTIVFDPKAIEEINYTPGAHSCSPSGRAVWTGDMRSAVFHLSDLGADYVVRKRKRNAARMSEENLRNGWGIHYLYSEDRMRSEFSAGLSNAVKIDEIENETSTKF